MRKYGLSLDSVRVGAKGKPASLTMDFLLSLSKHSFWRRMSRKESREAGEKERHESWWGGEKAETSSAQPSEQGRSREEE